MKIKFIEVEQGKKAKLICLIILLMLLFGAYLLLNNFEANSATTNKIDFKNKVGDYEFALGGEACGIKLLATGVLVVEIDNKDLDLKIGDVILKLDNTVIDSNAELIKYINEENVIKKGTVKLTISRNGKKHTVEARPIINKETSKYELGLWVKDSSAGVGIITFYELNNRYFAGLGHGITETSENIILPIQSGAIVKSKITGINKGHPKEPGDLRGTLFKDVYGQIKKNTVNGIYGFIEQESIIQNKKETIKAASKDEIKTGNAKIYCTLDDNQINEYEIKITNVIYNSSGNKNMIIEITDENLLEKTGGIVQGMSGSPIVQNGKLVGAVTHVFLNDPTKGYGVFIENMIEDINKIE